MTVFTKLGQLIAAPVDENGNARSISPQDFQVWMTEVERVVSAIITDAGSIAKLTKEELDASLNHGNDVMAWVYGDPVVANNGIYRKVGASGSGYWGKILPLPFSFIIASDAGAGTPNAIQATTSIPVSESALIFMNVFEPNTGSPVTVSFNGGSPLTVKTNSGEDVAVGGLQTGMVVLGRISGSTFRLANDEAIASLIYQARDEVIAARDEVEADREVVSGLASAFILAENTFATKATAEAWHPVAAPDFIRTAGYATAGDGGGALYKKEALEPSTPWKLRITLSDGVSQVWYSRTLRGRYQARDYALGQDIGDGVSRPLSTFFPSLASAQEIFPHAVALTDELDWAAAQAAVNKAQQNTFGGEVVLPGGRLYFGERTLRVTSSFIQISTEGGLTRIDRTATTGYAVHFASLTPPSRLFFVGIKNVYLISTVAMTAGGLLFFDQCVDLTIDRVKLENGWQNLHIRSCQNVQASNVRGTHGTLYGTWSEDTFTGTAANSNLNLDAITTASNPNNTGWFLNCDLRSQDTDDPYASFGVLIASADGLWFDTVHIGNAITANLACNPKSTTTQLTGLTCNNCWFDQGGRGRMVYLTGETTAPYGWMQFSDCYITGGPKNTRGYDFAPTGTTIIKHVEITGGKILSLQSYGIAATRMEGFTFGGGLQIRGVGQDGASACISLTGTCKKFNINGVNAGWNYLLTAAGASLYGLIINAGCVDFVVSGNNFSGNATAGLSDSSGAVNKVVASNLV